MMGDTGPCGPCSELHFDLTPGRRHARARSSTTATPRCIEIWNLVFIQFNANPDGTFSPLPAQARRHRHGLRARDFSIIQGTKSFTDFANAKISNYETDIFRPIFDALEKLSGKKYGSTLPQRERDLRQPLRVSPRIALAFRRRAPAKRCGNAAAPGRPIAPASAPHRRSSGD